MTLALTISYNLNGPALRRFFNREGPRNRVLAFEIEGGLEIVKGVRLGG